MLTNLLYQLRRVGGATVAIIVASFVLATGAAFGAGSPQQGKPAAVASFATRTDLTVVSATASSIVKMSIKYNAIGVFDMWTKGLRKKHGKDVCFWASGTWTNSDKFPAILPFREKSRAKFCWLRKPVRVNGVRYTAVKVAGGLSGKHCWNLAIPPGHKQPRPRIVGPVLDVKSLADLAIAVKADTNSNAFVAAKKKCGDTYVIGSATGTASVDSIIKLRIAEKMILASHGRVNANMKAYIRQQLKLMIENEAKSNATANIVIICSSTTPPNQTCPSGTTGTFPNCTPNTSTPTMNVKNVTSLQEVYNDGETYPNLFADANTPNGDSITCTVGVTDPSDHSQSGFGSIIGDRSITFVSDGADHIGAFTYQAPNDGTGSVVGQYDQIEVTCHDNSNSAVKDASAFSKPFEILAATANPV